MVMVLLAGLTMATLVWWPWPLLAGANGSSAGASTTSPLAPQATMVSLTEQDGGSTVTVDRHDLVRITLAETASTGYRWDVDRFDQGVLEWLDSKAAYKANVVGAVGEVTFLFRAKGPGLGAIHLKNWRHWEGDASITRRFDLNVQVRA